MIPVQCLTKRQSRLILFSKAQLSQC
jgi:hypothetical protein